MSNSTVKLLKHAFLDQVPLLSVVMTFLGLVQAIRGVSIDDNANGISAAVVFPGPGSISYLIGAALLFYTLILLKKRDNWIFYFVFAFPILTAFTFPYGQLIGLAFIAFALVKRKEFFEQKKSSSAAL